MTNAKNTRTECQRVEIEPGLYGINGHKFKANKKSLCIVVHHSYARKADAENTRVPNMFRVTEDLGDSVKAYHIDASKEGTKGHKRPCVFENYQFWIIDDPE